MYMYSVYEHFIPVVDNLRHPCGLCSQCISLDGLDIFQDQHVESYACLSLFTPGVLALCKDSTSCDLPVLTFSHVSSQLNFANFIFMI